MLPAERMQRWDEFVKDLYRHELHLWENEEEEIAIEKKTPEPNRVNFAKRVLKRLQEADSKVKRSIQLNRSIAQSNKTVGGWANHE